MLKGFTCYIYSRFFKMLQLAKFKNWNQNIASLEDDHQGNLTLTTYTIILWGIVSYIICWIRGLLLSDPNIPGAATFFIPLIALFFFFHCQKILKHQYNYLRHYAMDTRTFARSIRKYWSQLPSYLLTISLILIFSFWIGLVASFFIVRAFKNTMIEMLSVEYMEGTRLMDIGSVQNLYQKQTPPDVRKFWFGGVYMPWHELMTHGKLIGSAGSGKTNILKLYMQSVLPLIGSSSSDDRAILFDPKSEFYPFLRGMGIPEESITVLNPFDSRAYAWDIAADLNRSRDAATLARILIPKKKDNGGSGEFFDKAARRVFAGLAKFFINHAPGRWTLRDLVLGAQSMELVGLLAANDRKLARDLQVLGSGETAGNVVATVSAVIGDELETIAAYLDYAQRLGRTFTFKEWFNSSAVLLLGCDRESEATLQPYNELLVTRFCELATSRESEGTTHAIFDEVPALGKIGKKLDELARLGRSYKIPVLIAFQAYSSLKEIYGENVANSLIGQCDKSAYLRVVDSDSAKWASEQIGQVKKRRYTESTSFSRSRSGGFAGQVSISEGTSINETYETEPAVRPEDIMNIQKPSLEQRRGVMGYYKIGAHSYDFYLPSETLSKMAIPDDPMSVGYSPLDEELDSLTGLEEWEEDDLERLGILEFFQDVDEEKLKKLPISEWVQVSLQSVPESVVAELEETIKAN